jgi:curved DNA-binding protein CbpA
MFDCSTMSVLRDAPRFGEVWVGKGVRCPAAQIPYRVDDEPLTIGKTDPSACLMQNLYDLLGVRPNDDAENLRKAFRKAAMASHPDHQGGDPQAAARFRQITEAYDILRDAEQRAAYDRLLEFERRPLRSKLKRSVSDMKRHVVYDLIAGAILAVVLAGGYELFAGIPETLGNGAAGLTARESGQAAADDPAEQIGAAGRDRPEGVLAPQMPVVLPTALTAADDRDRVEVTRDEPASNPAGPAAVEVAIRDRAPDTPAANGVPGKNEGERLVRRDAPSFDVPFSAAEKRNNVPNAPASGDRRDGGPPEPAGPNRGGLKLPEIKMPARAAAAVKRQAQSRPSIEQAALENRNALAPDNTPPLYVFGIGH